jgi:acyl-CoA hydrolase
MGRVLTTAEAVADGILLTVGKHIVLGLPIGIGKATHIADALFERAKADRSITLTIFTGLTLETPRGANDMERRFLGPLAARLYADWPTPAYAQAMRAGDLPDNITVREFYLRPGAYLGNPLVQQNYTSINYSQVAAELTRLGVNVIAQLVAQDPARPGRYSLSSNPEVTLDLLPRLAARRRQGEGIAVVGQVNRHMPYMTGDADIDGDELDFILDNEALDFPLFTLPARRVSSADYATAMHVASLVRDGGTLQIGIGSLSDAVAHCLRLRNESPDVFRAVLEMLPGGSRSPRRTGLPIETGTFQEGLFASSELMSDALFSLVEAGVVRRPAGEQDEAVVHGGFFIGSTPFYEKLRSLGGAERDRINMTRISRVNTLFGDEARRRAQRRDGRFINECMMVTALGAAVSDGLEGGRVVSGVGGQFDFVAMAHQLEGAMSILMVRARRDHEGRAQSNIRWSYGHVTVPRHYRDVYVSEYGVAAVRGSPDSEVIDAMIGISDSAFQDELVKAAVAAGKVGRGYRVAADARDNSPARLDEVFSGADIARHFPAYPLGTELTETEQALADALEWLKSQTAGPLQTGRTIARAFAAKPERPYPEALARMGLDQVSSIRDRVARRLVTYALNRGASS